MWSARKLNDMLSDWAKIFDAYERGKITNHEAHTAMDKIRDLEWERLDAKRARVKR
jgi:hypothetical protein